MFVFFFNLVNSHFFNRANEADIPVYANNYPSGVWEDVDTAAGYPDMQDLDEYQPQDMLQYRQKAYENLQNILNPNVYDEPIAMPIQYNPYQRYYSDRQKRSNLRNFGGIR